MNFLKEPPRISSMITNILLSVSTRFETKKNQNLIQFNTFLYLTMFEWDKSESVSASYRSLFRSFVLKDFLMMIWKYYERVMAIY